MAHAMPTVLNRDDRASFERLRGLLEDVAQALDNEIHPGVPEAEHDDAGASRETKSDDFAEIQIEREQRALLTRRFREHASICQAMQSLLTQVGNIVTSGA